MTEHVLHTPENCKRSDPDERCIPCDGWLSLCVVCGGAESCLPTDCPGVKISSDMLEMITAEMMDFKDGEWVCTDIPCGRCRGTGCAECIDNVIDADIVTTLGLDPDKVLTEAVDKLEEVVVAGWTEEGELYVASSIEGDEKTLWLLEKAKLMLLAPDAI